MPMFKVREGYGYYPIQPAPLPALGPGELVELNDINEGDQPWKLQEATAPAEVTGLGATPGDTEVVLTWTDPVDADFVSVEITSDVEGSQPVTVLAGIETATITDLVNDVEVTFTVKTVDALGNKSAGVTVASTPAAPEEITGLLATPGDTEVVLTWTDPGYVELDHILVDCDVEGFTPVSIATGVETATITGLTNGVEVNFTVKTVNTLGDESTGVEVASTPTAP